MTYNKADRCTLCNSHVAEPHAPNCPLGDGAKPFHLKDFRLDAGLSAAELARSQGKLPQLVHQSERFDDWKLSTIRSHIEAAGASAIIVVTLANGDQVTYTL